MLAILSGKIIQIKLENQTFNLLFCSFHSLFRNLWEKIAYTLRVHKEGDYAARAAKTRMWYFWPGYGENNIRNSGMKRAIPEHMFVSLAFGSCGN